MTTVKPDKHGVVAVFTDDEGRFLFIKRGETLARAPGWWCFVGGEVERGETLEAAIEREMREEVGLDVTAREKVFESISPNGEFLLHWMRVMPRQPGQTMALHAKEVAEARWLTPREALRMKPMLPALERWLRERVREDEEKRPPPAPSRKGRG
jgi:8-oxo-dGTP diphosphatase